MTGKRNSEKYSQATKEAGEASKKPIELKIEQTNKEIADLEKSLKAQNIEIGANEIVRTNTEADTALKIAQAAKEAGEASKKTIS